MSSIRKYILSNVEHSYNLDKLSLNESEETILSDFINNSQTLLLQFVKESEKELKLYTDIQNLGVKTICFYKSTATELTTESSLKYINIVTLANNPLESFYHIIKTIFLPLLSAFPSNELHFNKLQKNLTDLESILRIVSYGKSDVNTNVIFTIEDELQYWKNLGDKKETSRKEKEAAANFSELFNDIIEEIREMHAAPMSEIREAVENIGGLLDDVWRYTLTLYPQDRMIHVFDIIGHGICMIIQNVCSSYNLWVVENESEEYDILNLLCESLKVMCTWTSACQSLTETYWPNYALHPWIGKPYVPSFCSNFEVRLKKIYDMRSTYSQLFKLLTINERSELKMYTLFDAFKEVNVWLCNGQNNSWEVAATRFSASLRPAETKIAEKLKPRFHNKSTKQMLYEYMRYQSLIQSPYVKQALNTELEIFVSSLLTMLKSIQEQLDADELNVKLYKPPEMSTVVHQVQWAKQMESKVKEIHDCADKNLKDFDGCNELLNLSNLLLKQLKQVYTQLYEEWCRDLQAQAKNGALSLSMDKPVVEFSNTSKLMVVNFNPKLVWAELETRALIALGFPAPSFTASLDTLQKTLTHARALQQVASFHNTLGERMIPSTRPMMLQAALDLSALVQNQEAVYWDDIEQLTNYTDKLREMVFKLETQNTYLTSQHMAIRGIVEKLLDTELLAKQAEWKKSVKQIRDIIEMVENNGYKNTELWRSHWDWQLYKVLECQYIITLQSLHKHFPHFRVDLLLRGHMVRVQPPMEEVRVQHYHQLRRLVSIPANFVGVQSNLTQNDSIFSAIVEKHSWLGNKAVTQIEATLSSLERLCKDWTKRAALACVEDLEALCKEHLHDPRDWELNFKACKAYGQAVAKMTFEDEKIEWITVGTVTLRREFEAQTRTLWSCLMSTLQSSCLIDAADINAFVANARIMLENKTLPQNSKELTEFSLKQQALQANMPEMETTVENLKKKSHMLRTWGGDIIVDGTIKEWKKIHEMLVGQQQLFEHQAEIVKSGLSGEWSNLNTTVEAWASRWTQTKLRYEEVNGASYDEIVDRCRSVYDAYAQWEKYLNDRDDLIKECKQFKIKVELEDIWRDTEKLMDEFMNTWSVLKEYNEEYESIVEQEWIVFQKKLHLLDELVCKWKNRLEPYTMVTLYIQQELEKYTDLSLSLKYLRGTDFTERHWREVFNLLDIEYKKPDTLLVKDLLAASINIKKHVKELQKICTSASSESAIRSALNELELWYAGARFSITYFNNKTQKQTPIVKDFKDILSKIEEQQWVVSSVSGGDASCGTWEARLRAARALVRALYHAQRRWLYLEPILSVDEGELGNKFKKVDQGFRQVTRIVESDPRLSALLHTSRVQAMLDSISEQLHACQSGLNKYIDDKRTIFPRFYFLSDDDLLELLGQARAGVEGRHAVMQTHLKKLFPGITSVRLGPGDTSITALCSHFGEIFKLDQPVDIDCPVELWLKGLEIEMRSSLKMMTLKCMAPNSLQEQDPFTLPTQILCLTQNIRFTKQVERAIVSKDLHTLKANVEKEHLSYAAAEVDDEGEQQKRQALILQCTHYMGVIRTLIDSNVTSVNDWLWQKQLRFYLVNSEDVIAKMGLAQISYSYEYLGVNTGHFVRTELADECFLILTQSLQFGFVGNPFGPAGTGKTESVKALGGLFGRLVLIFNCDEAMDSECMGRLLTGLALSGAWGCFDEFNRLAGDTLAALSHQLASLLSATQQGKRGQEPSALLNGRQISVSEWCGVAATMNPAGRGYGGRRQLPAALESVLRPIAMVQPRGDQLSSHLLAARCIPHSDVLARDLHNVFVMAEALLSGQRHYDWGLRALKAAVGSCGTALAGMPQKKELPQLKAVIRHVLALNNISKLTTIDAERFKNILSLVFGHDTLENITDNTINLELQAAAQNLEFIPNDLQRQKCVELYEQLQQRMGVVIVGPPGSGKTTIRKILKSALIRQGKSIMEYVICPKAMSRDWLLGNIDHDTRQWTDGVISTTALEISNQQPDITSWVVCDGDIDPEWIEALNSVLDENRLLTLPSGWRIQFGANVNFIFETHSLEHASPATVSRMGIILFSDDISCHADVVENWIRKVDVESDLLQSTIPLLQRVIEMSIQWISGHRSDAIIKVNNVALVRNILTQFEYIVQNMTHSSGTISEELVYLAVERSLLGILKENAVGRFHEELSNILGPCVPSPLLHGEWVSDNLFMSPRLSAIEPILRACFSSNNSHSLIIGPEGSAKSILAEYIVKDSNSNVITIVCTPILEPSNIIAELKRNNLIQSSGAGGARVTLLVRALHRARVDSWGSSPVQNFLLQLIHHGGFWNRDSEEENCGTQWSYISRVRVVAIANNASMLSPRLVAAFAQCTVPEPDNDEVLELTTHCLRNCVDKNFKNKEQIPNVSKNLLSFFKEVTETFYSRLHYKWNVSHLKKCCINVKWYSPSDVDELVMAIIGEVNSGFKDGLVSEDEKSEFITLVKKHFKYSNLAIYYMCKLKADGVYMESVEYNVWYQITEKLINQCLSEHEYNVFGDTCAEVCSELAVLCPAVARTANGELLTCIGNAGCGRRAAAVISSASLPSTLIFINHTSQFNPQMKNAISSSGDGTRTITVICEPAVTVETLAYVEALKHAHSIHAIPTAIMPNSNTPNLLQNVKQNLGIMICLDKTQENLHDLLEKFPIIYNDGHLVWLDRISDSSLRELPPLIIQRLTKENMLDMPKEELSDVPVYGFVNIFNNLDVEQMRAPCKYYKFVKTYYHIISTKKASLTKRQKTLSAGVDALCRARSEVKTLQEDAAQQSTALADKRAKANQALDQIGATVQATTDKKEEMHLLKKNIEIENEKLQQQKKEIEAELASVEPVIAAARAAVGDIRPESLSEIRSLRAPPDVVRDVLEGVLRLMGIADTSWHSMKNFLSKRGVKEDIRCMDASQITESAVESVRRLLERRRASFDPSAARRASAACAPLAAWVLANLRHAHALANVRPLQAQQAKLHKSLEEAENQLSALSSGLATVDERVAALKEQLGQHTRDAATIELSLTNATNTIQAAKQLLDQLAHEYDTWENDLENISKEIADLKPRSLLAAAYIIYLPEVTEPQAREFLNNWKKKIEYEDGTFSANNFLSSIEKQLKWDADGLPSDHSAIKNAVLVDQILEANCGFTPLIVDPDGDGINWLRNTLANVQCEFVSQQSEKLQTAVQYAVRLGKILVITDVDTVHECWSTLLYGLPVSASSMSAPITVKLILHCRDETLPSRLPPNYAARISILHFTARLDGLTDQLVYFALQQQNPEITEKTKEIKLKKVTLQKQQHELQEHLLRDLSSNSDILHDANLLASLNKTRTTNATIIEALQAALTIEESNRAACEVYSTSARRLATLALAVRRLAGKRSFVTLPVDAILDIYVDAIKTIGDRSRTNDEELLKYVTRRVIERVLLGLHKKDKYIIVLYLLKEAYEDMFPEELWRLLIKSDDFMDDLSNIQEIKQSYQWVHNDCLKKIANLKVINKNLFDKLSLDKADMWKDYLKHGDVNILSGLKLTPFEIVVVVSVIRPDSTYRTIVSFVEQMLGVGAVWGGDAVGVAARGARAARGRRGRPLLVRGAHAAALLAAHAHANNRAFTQVGVEEGRSAWESALEKGRLGGWVALVVGASPFTPQLQTFIVAFSEISTEEFDEEFRLWIVSEDRDIPPLISNACVNLVLESPEGVKNNVMGTLSAWGNFEGDPKTMRLHACLALFHALVQERRAYIPQGWSRWYAWEWGEVQACAGALRGGGGGGGGQAPLWLALYGARVNAAADRRVLTALHAACLNPARVSITLPHTPRLQDYTSAFNGLPDIDSPQLLGLPANCRIAWEKNAANSILTGLKELNSTVSVTQNNLSNAPMKALLGLWKKLMSGSPLIKADYQIPTAQSGGWWGCVCGAEAAEARRGAAALHAALAGARARRHPMHAVPDEWQLLWAGPDAPDAYLKEFCFRAKAAVARLETTDFHSDYMPSEVDLRCFLRPARVIWALRVRTALRLSCPVDSLALIVKWNCLKGASGGDGSLVVTGLRLSGGRAGAEAGVGARGRGREEAAGANAAALSAAEGSSPPHAPAPPLLLTYLPQHANSPLISESSIDVPVYTNELREEIVFYARTQLARDFDRDTALLNAIALFIAPIE